MGKSMRSDLPISYSTISLQNFPTELLFITFQELDIPTLLKVCNACKRFQQTATEILSKKFNEPGVELRMCFEQEYKIMYNLPFTFSKFNRKNGNFIFKPKSSNSMGHLRFVHSPMVKSPDLSKIFITIPNNVTSNASNDLSSSTTTTSNSSPSSSSSLLNSSKKNNQLKKNFLEKPITLNIKSNGNTLEEIEEIRYVYRIGHGTTHLKVPYVFTYKVTDTPPPSMQNTRGGERWLKPISFECAPSFFYPNEPIAYKIFMKIRYLGKRNSHKKPLPSSPSSQIQDRKQKQKDDIGFKEVGDFISIEVAQEDTNCKEQQQQQQQQSVNKNLRVQLYLKGNHPTRWLKGARR